MRVHIHCDRYSHSVTRCLGLFLQDTASTPFRLLRSMNSRMPRHSCCDVFPIHLLCHFPTGCWRNYFSFLYSSSLTGSSHSLELFSPGTSIARCENHSSGAAPCQCLTPVGILMQSPGFFSTASLPSS